MPFLELLAKVAVFVRDECRFPQQLPSLLHAAYYYINLEARALNSQVNALFLSWGRGLTIRNTGDRSRTAPTRRPNEPGLKMKGLKRVF